MKSTIKILGVATFSLLSLTNVFAKQFVNQLDQLDQFTDEQLIITNVEVGNNISTESETALFLPSEVMNVNVKNTIETIKEDFQIVSQQVEGYMPLVIDRTIEDVIVEDKSIIGQEMLSEEFELDFEKINSNSFSDFQNKLSVAVEEIKL
jgi:hypothetical protein